MDSIFMCIFTKRYAVSRLLFLYMNTLLFPYLETVIHLMVVKREMRVTRKLMLMQWCTGDVAPHLLVTLNWISS